MANFSYRKVADVRDHGTHMIVIRKMPTNSILIFDPFPYRVYKVSCGHRKQICKSSDLCGAIKAIYTWLVDGNT